MAKTPKSFIREIFKVTENSGIVSFAGGLSNSALIDVDGIAQAAARVLADDGRSVLQYSPTEGYLPLRQFIADRYKKRLGLTVLPEEILITNGSRQCLDLIGKVLINAGDHIAIEWPGYLGAIQAFSLPSFRGYIPEQTIITGSFSKILAPGMRLGWIVAPEAIMEQIVIAKQASDLPSSSLSQRIAVECLSQGTIDHHIKKIQGAYKNQCECMLHVMADTFPDSVTRTRPHGGMFVWVTLPDGYSSQDVFDAALQEHVAVLLGTPFYIDGGGGNTMRLNFSNSTDEKIVMGIGLLARVIKNVCGT